MIKCPICLQSQESVLSNAIKGDPLIKVYLDRYNIPGMCPQCLEKVIHLFETSMPDFISWLLEYDQRKEGDEIISIMRRDFDVNEDLMSGDNILTYIDNLERYAVFLENLFLNRGPDDKPSQNI